MDWSEILAIYAGIVATASLGWQIFTYWHSRRPNISVSASPAIFVSSEEASMELFKVTQGGADEAPSVDWSIDVVVLNQGRGRVQLTSLAIYQPASRLGWDGTDLAKLPRWLDPNEHAVFHFDSDDLDGAKITDRFEARVHLATKQAFSASLQLIGAGAPVTLPASVMEAMISKLGKSWDDFYMLQVSILSDESGEHQE